MARTLKEKATLVSLTLRKWQNEITDERVTEQADKANKATNAGRYKKNLVRKEAMKAIQTAYSALRTNFYLYTLGVVDHLEVVVLPHVRIQEEAQRPQGGLRHRGRSLLH